MNRSRWPSREPATQSGGYRHGDSNPGTSPATSLWLSEDLRRASREMVA